MQSLPAKEFGLVHGIGVWIISNSHFDSLSLSLSALLRSICRLGFFHWLTRYTHLTWSFFGVWQIMMERGHVRGSSSVGS